MCHGVCVHITDMMRDILITDHARSCMECLVLYDNRELELRGESDRKKGRAGLCTCKAVEVRAK